MGGGWELPLSQQDRWGTNFKKLSEFVLREDTKILADANLVTARASCCLLSDVPGVWDARGLSLRQFKRSIARTGKFRLRKDSTHSDDDSSSGGDPLHE